MKKILLTVSVLASSAAAMMAQTTPDFSFETWNNVPFSTTVQDPQGWASLNVLNVFTATQLSVFKETTSPAEGATSAKISTVKITGAAIPNPYQTGNLDTAGLLAIGQLITAPSPGIKYGFNYTWRPTILSFQSKYTPMTGDSAFVFALLTKWNGTGRDTIAWGTYATGDATTSYSLNSLNMTYNPSFSMVSPDSQQVFISSSVFRHDGAKIGSTFYIDDMEWTGWNSISELNGSNATVTVYPNPATTEINFSCSTDMASIEVSDITGRLIGTYPANQNKVSVATGNFVAGMYIYTVKDENKQIIGRSRFEITK
ncbi:MAG: T9SS type A sorting domain-containing protein [Bacteroidia bacterium]|jgi:hypothetical protein